MRSTFEDFAEAVSVTDAELNLAKAALLFAAGEYPNLTVQHYLDRLDSYAELIRQRVTEDQSIANHILQINQFLFVEKSYSSDNHSYYDPRNSFLNEVMDRKLGIPITLSLLYIEIAQRLGVPINGVSFPGHFLVKVSLPQGELVLDPYTGGHPISRDELEEHLAHVLEEQGHDLITLAQALSPANKRDILISMLRNIKVIYWQQEAWEKALNVVNHLLTITPDLPVEVRDTGLLYLQLNCPLAARHWLARYLHLAPEADDSEAVLEQLEQLAHPHFILH
jgi:regulator of sirC expression with transglutaminase-like and TPR domain